MWSTNVQSLVELRPLFLGWRAIEVAQVRTYRRDLIEAVSAFKPLQLRGHWSEGD